VVSASEKDLAAQGAAPRDAQEAERRTLAFDPRIARA
jgi:hypothetical protein